ncbi:FimV/HubP family polar landmark protein [Thauera sp. Sel9]|uniref:FimV/HubP family polar landmark protein n=1 Tax=Thauera sp. Sel9 TaxID=2974299 RepID=UPI0021E13E9C|nr:FimV/HubP family polar landmark protein [Thauera sp. Sel9]MCV2218054.1 LysM peptidoglycan-binding domain-containing protein [Thauera sp. Sel9]
MMKTSLKASLIALAIASIPLGSQAAGLGQINVFSGLGQPLRAEIQVNATAQELQSLTARIASPEAFQRASIAYSAAAAAIRVSVDARSSRPVVRLSSDRPINDPFVDLLVELDWANGRVAREYTFLLDPVDLTAPQPLAAAVDRPAAPAASSQAPARSAPPPAARVPADAYTVRRGDTLNRIATANAQPGVTLDQMLVALYRANRNAFDGGNINRLRAGEVLAIPAADAARSIAPAEARREIRVHSADFDAYRRGLAAAAARRAPAQQAEAGQESAGRIVPRVEEPQAPADSGDQLRVSRSQPAEGSADANSRLQALEEELAARERALEEANARLAQLEASINDMKKLLELRSAPLAQLQQEAEGVPPAAEPPLSPVAGEAAAEPLLSAAAVDTPAVTEAPAAASDALAPADEAGRTEPAQRAEAPTEAAGAEAAAPEPTEVAEAAAVKDAPPAVAEEAAAPPPKRPVRRAPPPPPPPEPSFMESMMEDPSVIAGGGGILALLLGYAGLKLRNRRKAATAAPAPEALSELAPGGQSVFAATGGQSVDTAASSIMQTDFSQTGLSAIDADEGVDPVAEADVYMAYGRDAQAEEILQDALKADPARTAIHLKLLEIYAQRKDPRQFETVASELFAQSGGQGNDWEKAAAMGRKLDADNPLYAEKPSENEVPTEMPLGVAAGAAATAAVASAAAPAAAEAPADNSSVEVAPAAAPARASVPASEPASLADLDFTSSLPMGPSQSQMRDTWMVPGELSQLGGDKESDGEGADAVQPPAAIDAAAEAAAPEAGIDGTLDAGVIDFELDLGDETPAAAVATQAAEDAGLAFDLEIDEPDSADGVAESEASAAEESPQAAATADVGLASALDFELPDLDLTPAEPQPGANNDVPTPVVDIEQTSFDSSLLDFDFDIDTPVPPPAAGAASLDLTSIDLDLDNFDTSPAEDGTTVPISIEATQLGQSQVDFAAADMLDADLAASGDEVETKLELARAYDDMGDKEGALELLDEVLREGSEAQQAAAREMIARLS